MRPRIGITLDSEESGGYAAFPWYALRQNYAASIAEAGGLPFGLPHLTEEAEAYLGLMDGLVVTGGDFDVDPQMYGDDTRHDRVILKDARTRFEAAMIRGALEKDMPVLGICGGQQLLHVVLGGSLIQHIPDSVPNALEHEQPNPRDESGHTVAITEGTLLHRITGTASMAVNSAHHQAAKDAPEDVVINAVAPDGVIEGMEHPGYRFCLGIQWHPEFTIGAEDRAILKAFVNAADDYRRE